MASPRHRRRTPFPQPNRVVHPFHLYRKTGLKGKSGIARAVYVTAVGRRIVVVHVFTKKTQKTPRREIEIALKRAKEV
jgi:phage-related protein